VVRTSTCECIGEKLGLEVRLGNSDGGNVTGGRCEMDNIASHGVGKNGPARGWDTAWDGVVGKAVTAAGFLDGSWFWDWVLHGRCSSGVRIVVIVVIVVIVMVVRVVDVV